MRYFLFLIFSFSLLSADYRETRFLDVSADKVRFVENKFKWPHVALGERFDDYYKLLLNRDYEKCYDFLDLGIRERLPVKRFIADLKESESYLDFLSVDILRIDYMSDLEDFAYCRVIVEFTFTNMHEDVFCEYSVVWIKASLPEIREGNKAAAVFLSTGIGITELGAPPVDTAFKGLRY